MATGIGVAQARESARRALQTLGRPRLVISTGVAGALAPDLRAGDMVIADRLLLEESPDSSFVEVARMAPDGERSVRDALGRTGLTIATGPLLTAGWGAAGAAAQLSVRRLDAPARLRSTWKARCSRRKSPALVYRLYASGP